MKSPTSIVNTLLESDHADYDPSLDHFSDPKNITYGDLGYAYISKEDMVDFTGGNWLWGYHLSQFGLITAEQALAKEKWPPSVVQFVDSIDKIYIEQVPIPLREAVIEACELTKSALTRISDTLEHVGPHGRWNVKLVSVEYK